MDRRELKNAARGSLDRAETSPRRLTLLFLLVLYAVSVPCNIVSEVMSERLSSLSGLDAIGYRNGFNLYYALIFVFLGLILPIWQQGYTWFSMRVSRGENATFGNFAKGLRMFGQVFLLYLLQIIFITLWSMLLILPGIVAAYRYRLAFYLLFDNPDMSAFEALNASKELTRGHKMDLFLLDLSFFWYYLLLMAVNALAYADQIPAFPIAGSIGFIAVYLASTVLAILVQVWKMPYVEVTYAHAYEKILEG